jgi:hypothetical protein
MRWFSRVIIRQIDRHVAWTSAMAGLNSKCITGEYNFPSRHQSGTQPFRYLSIICLKASIIVDVIKELHSLVAPLGNRLRNTLFVSKLEHHFDSHLIDTRRVWKLTGAGGSNIFRAPIHLNPAGRSSRMRATLLRCLCVA